MTSRAFTKALEDLYSGSAFTGPWTDASIGRKAIAAALDLLRDAANRCADEDMRKTEVFAALAFLEAQADRKGFFRQFRTALDIEATERRRESRPDHPKGKRPTRPFAKALRPQAARGGAGSAVDPGGAPGDKRGDDQRQPDKKGALTEGNGQIHPWSNGPPRLYAAFMEKMTIELISVVEKGGHIRARLRATAEEIGVTARLAVTFDALPEMSRKDCIEEAYDRALAILDPA